MKLDTIEEVNKVLFVQKAITRRAKEELLSLAADSILQDPNNVAKVRAFMADERKLLEKYTSYPTLSEFEQEPALYDSAKWGATFGVTLLVNDLIFEQVKSIQGVFEPILRSMFLLLLRELNHPTQRYLIDSLEKSVRLTSVSPSIVGEKERRAFVRHLIQEMVAAIMHVSAEYQLMAQQTEGWIILPLGKRVLLHLIDAQKFISQLAEAHGRLQVEKPKLSMI